MNLKEMTKTPDSGIPKFVKYVVAGVASSAAALVVANKLLSERTRKSQTLYRILSLSFWTVTTLLMGFLLADKLFMSTNFPPALVTSSLLNDISAATPEYDDIAVSWRVEFRRSARIQVLLDRRESFASPILQRETEYLFHKQKSARGESISHKHQSMKHAGIAASQKWFIFLVASDIDGALLSANACGSLSNQGISRCVLVGLTYNVKKWWQDQDADMRGNMSFHDGQSHFEWCRKLKMVQDRHGILVDEEIFWHIQGVVLYRLFLLLDVLHAGVNVWLLDTDVVLTGDPEMNFMNSKGITTLVNPGTFRNIGQRAESYSYPFLLDNFKKRFPDNENLTIAPDSVHLTLNNGVIAVQSNPTTRLLMRQVADRVVNDEIVDPQHPFNKLMIELGLQLFPSVGREDMFEGSVRIPLSISHGGGVLEFSGIIAETAYEDSNLSSPIVYHAVGISGMAGPQGKKIDWFRSKNLLFIKV